MPMRGYEENDPSHESEPNPKSNGKMTMYQQNLKKPRGQSRP